jgi:exosome complex exonuclease DIS3/RRP44
MEDNSDDEDENGLQQGDRSFEQLKDGMDVDQAGGEPTAKVVGIVRKKWRP